MPSPEDGTSPFTVEVFDRQGIRRAYIGAPLALRLVIGHNAPAFCSIEVANDHRAVPALLAKGARLRLTYVGERHTGPVRRIRLTGSQLSGRVAVEMDGDLRIALVCMLAWQRPDAALTGQDREYDVRSGPAETVAKALIAANARRLGIPLRVLPDQGRGRRIRVNARMHPTGDLLMPLIDKAGIGLTLVRDGDSYVLDAYAPKVYPRTLTEAGGTVLEATVTRQGPTATRVVLGGGGEGVKREFVQVVDEAREAEWADIVEVFRDADDAASDYNSARADTLRVREDQKDRKSDLVDADKEYRLLRLEADATAEQRAAALKDVEAARTELAKVDAALAAAVTAEASERAKYRAELLERGAETLAEGAPLHGLSVTLSDTEHFGYGGKSGVRVGDLVPLEVGPGFVHTDVLREVAIDWTAENGLKATPVVGEVVGDTTDRLVGALTAAARAVRTLWARK